MKLLAYFFWDPDRIIFTLPYLNHPVAWYGLCFACAFIAGYFLIIHLLKHDLTHSLYYNERHISNWSHLIEVFKQGIFENKKEVKSLFEKLDMKTQEQIMQYTSGSIVSNDLRAQILQCFNNFVFQTNQPHQVQRNILEKSFNLITPKRLALLLTDKLTWYIVIAIIFGARLGYVFFYGWPDFRYQLMDIFKIWKGGLASHGGILAMLLSMWLYCRMIGSLYPRLTYLRLLDLLTIPAAFLAFCIRMGNFINQEIIGLPTTVPWAIIFGRPGDGSWPVPRHPVQLYEGLFYFFTSISLYAIWKYSKKQFGSGFFIGLFFFVVFTFRFLIEFIKSPTSHVIAEEQGLLMGQYLSIPLMLFGLFLLLRSYWVNRKVLL